MTEVLILNPPRRSDGMTTLFNNATLSLASYLHRHGVSARTEPLIGPFWIDHLDRLLEEHRPELVAISCKWWDTLYGAVELARLIRRRAPGVRLVCGGQTATFFAEDLVQKTDFDAVVLGDGERPLLELARGQPTCNVLQKDGTRLPQDYVQGSADDLRLAGDLSALATPTMLRAIGYDVPFVWTGKGCRQTCLYCAGSALGHKRLFGRSGYTYRPIEHVLHDMEVLAPWSGDTFMFDFDPIADPGKGDYYYDLFRALPAKKYHLDFYCWTLPEPSFVELVAERFRSAFISFDVQAYGEAHRAQLAGRRAIKPFRANADYEALIRAIDAHPNLEVGLYGIVGLPGERDDDLRDAERWLQHLFATFGDVLGEVEVSPLATEPGALVHQQPEKYGMRLLRRTFEDYLEFTRHKYFSRLGIHEQPFDPHLPHPYGVFDEGASPSRTWEQYHRLRGWLAGQFTARRQAMLTDGFSWGHEGATLRLRNRAKHRHVWDLVTSAITAVGKSDHRRLHVDATRAFVHVPEREVMALTGTHDHTLVRLDGIGAALASGALEVTIDAAPGQRWGAFAEAGARVREVG
jgi:radical SAM superfamily enzyme YgiQ (UPF0313 family)